MRYVTGLHAVALREPGDPTACDWHGPAYDWANVPLRESDDSRFGDWGIEQRTYTIAGMTYEWNVASHVRACLDMLEQGLVGDAQGMRENYIGNEALTPVLLEHAAMLEDSRHWSRIMRLMGREYGTAWLQALAAKDNKQ